VSRGHNKAGSRRKTGDWQAIARGRANKSRYHRETMRCPSSRHLINVNSLKSHMNVCR